MMNCSINVSLCRDDLIHYNITGGIYFGGVENCSQSCTGYEMVPLQQNILKYTIISFSILCLVSSLASTLVYAINYSKVRNPEAPVYYVSICYIGISLCHIISSLVPQNAIRCDDRIHNSLNTSVIRHDGLQEPLCVVMFVLLYYCTLASWTWGLLTTVEWFLCTIKTKRLSQRTLLLMHFIGWGSPTPLLAGALGGRAVSGSYPLQTCWITEQKDGAFQMSFVIAPSLTIIAACSVILIAGFVRGLYQIKKMDRVDMNKQDHDRPSIPQLARTNAFCVVFLICLGFSMGFNFYEYNYQLKWERTYLETKLNWKDNQCFPKSETHSGYIITFYIIRFLFSQVLGVLLMFWTLKKDFIYRSKKSHQCSHTTKTDTNNIILQNTSAFSDTISSITS